MMTLRRAMIAVLALCLAATSLTGCKAEKVIEAVWPKADSERTIPKPAAPPRWPLTGLDAPDDAATKTRVVSVKIENSPAARPQSGLDQADIVYETVTEGGITRFNAFFQSKSPALVGPVRSARLSDTYIVPQYHALFAHCGGDSSLRAELADKARFDDVDQFFNPSAYWRAGDRSAPHNLMTDISKVRTQGIEARHYEAELAITGLSFRKAPPSVGATCTLITVPFSQGNTVSWLYDAGARTYARSINGEPHSDRESKKPYTTSNVAVLWAKTRQVKTTKFGGAWIEIVLTGSGRCTVFRDGMRLDGTWATTGKEPPVFKTADGAQIKFAPGTTWFQVIANDQNISFK
jgi:Protein of unknown function (DUF3048) N-terminal domain/Protein of unknown function (DUF3048) C-terminal domain